MKDRSIEEMLPRLTPEQLKKTISYGAALASCLAEALDADGCVSIFDASTALAIVFDVPKEKTLEDLTWLNRKNLRQHKGMTVIDEVCKCGHLKSQHNDNVHGSMVAQGHGSCLLCDCKRFTWKDTIYSNTVRPKG